ncbi:MAG: hypothetical protein M3680_07810 [Myxococcota bacterium]|nr:hypothetical protein [Myxococcota bacterium]
MIHEYLRMKYWGVVMGVVVGLVVVGCGTKPNPQSCKDGLCTDQAYPFCDLDGSLGGEPQECIAVQCTANEFEACRGDLAVTCNASGNDYEFVDCPLGCEAGIGCKLCEPNETRCTNGTVATCDANGAIAEMESCPLGCFEDEPRCRELASSNNLDVVGAMFPDAPDLELTNATVFSDTGAIAVEGAPVVAPSFLVQAQGAQGPIRVFVMGRLRINGMVATVSGDPRNSPGPAIAFLAHKDIRLEGTLVVEPRVGSAILGCMLAGAGNVHSPADGLLYTWGGGGGAHASDGGEGGAITDYSGPLGAKKGESSGSATLQPLRGGCSGGFHLATAGTHANGGGAVQFSSGHSIVITGEIDARGRNGELETVVEDTTSGPAVGGGGAGGGILLEAPRVEFMGATKVRVSGGHGASACQVASRNCGLGGTGASVLGPASDGGDITGNTPDSKHASGGGGGGLGRVRINTADGTYVKSSEAVEDGSLTTDVIRTR